MPGGNKNIRPEDNTNGFQKNPQNIGRKPKGATSLIATNKKLTKNGGWLRKPASEIKKVRNKPYYDVWMATREYLYNTLHQILANPKTKDQDKIKAATYLIDRIDGKPKQSVEVEQKMDIPKVPFEAFTLKDFDEFDHLEKYEQNNTP